ncbi:hypothetical protein Tco_0790750 [Tanacetum coccineum]
MRWCCRCGEVAAAVTYGGYDVEGGDGVCGVAWWLWCRCRRLKVVAGDEDDVEMGIVTAVANAYPNLTAALRTRIANGHQRMVMELQVVSGVDAIPQGIHVWSKFTKLKFRLCVIRLEVMAFAILVTWVAFREIFLQRSIIGEFTRLASFVGATVDDAQEGKLGHLSYLAAAHNLSYYMRIESRIMLG